MVKELEDARRALKNQEFLPPFIDEENGKIVSQQTEIFCKINLNIQPTLTIISNFVYCSTPYAKIVKKRDVSGSNGTKHRRACKSINLKFFCFCKINFNVLFRATLLDRNSHA